MNMHVARIMESCEVEQTVAEKIEATMAALGLRFSECSEEEFDSTAMECLMIIESGVELV